MSITPGTSELVQDADYRRYPDHQLGVEAYNLALQKVTDEKVIYWSKQVSKGTKTLPLTVKFMYKWGSSGELKRKARYSIRSYCTSTAYDPLHVQVSLI